jgi:hypothetical protein
MVGADHAPATTSIAPRLIELDPVTKASRHHARCSGCAKRQATSGTTPSKGLRLPDASLYGKSGREKAGFELYARKLLVKLFQGLNQFSGTSRHAGERLRRSRTVSRLVRMKDRFGFGELSCASTVASSASA